MERGLLEHTLDAAILRPPVSSPEIDFRIILGNDIRWISARAEPNPHEIRPEKRGAGNRAPFAIGVRRFRSGGHGSRQTIAQLRKIDGADAREEVRGLEVHGYETPQGRTVKAIR